MALISSEEWSRVYLAVDRAVEACKDASGQHRAIDLVVNRAQITHDVMGTDTAPVRPEAKASRTLGMNTAARILHVGGRTNAAGYVELGSIQAVEALIRQCVRDGWCP